MPGEAAGCDFKTRSFQLATIIGSGTPALIDAQPERRPLIVRGQHRVRVQRPVGAQCIDEPRRMSGPYRRVAIERCTQLRAFTLAAAQHRIHEPCGARLFYKACRSDGFVYRRVGRNVRVQQLAQSDNAQRVQIGFQLLSFSQQLIQQRIEPDVPANAVVAE